MTKLKPSFLSTLEEMQRTLGELAALCDLPIPQNSDSDGSRKGQHFRRSTPVELISSAPLNITKGALETVKSSTTANRAVGHPQLAFSAISMVCVPSEAGNTAQYDRKNHGSFEHPVNPSSAACVHSASLETGCVLNNPARLQTPSCETLCHWLQTIKPLVIPTLLILISPWTLSKYLIVPWMIGRVLRISQKEHGVTVDITPGMPRELWHAAALLVPRSYETAILVLVPLLSGAILPWTVWKMLCVPWMTSRALKLAIRGEGSVSLVACLVTIGVVLVTVWEGTVPWVLWEIVSMLVVLLYALPAFLLETCMG